MASRMEMGKEQVERNLVDEIRMCACIKVYDTTDMSNCKGINCSNSIRRTSVPLYWLCGKCVKT